MKKLIITAFVILATLIITSCEDFLEEVPKNQLDVGQFFKNTEEIKMVVNSLYGQGATSRYNAGRHWHLDMMLGGYMSGFFVNERPERPGPYEANNLIIDGSRLDEYMSNWWQEGYEIISTANIVIKYMPLIPDISESEANRLLAEAKFFRGFDYFFLVRDFGDVPLVTVPYESLENIYVKREPAEIVYGQIITDLEWALNNGGLADVPFHMNGYRITKGIVATTLANVYLQHAGYPIEGGQESYANAANYARMVINSGEYKLIDNGSSAEESAYNVMRTSDSEREYIYSIEVDPQFRINALLQYTIPRQSSPPGFKTGSIFNAYRPLDEFISVYDAEKDLRIHNKQLFHNNVERNGIIYEFNEWAPHLWYNEFEMFDGTGRSGIDVRIYRYAEALLIAAEAIARSEGVTNEAISYLADVRHRAYWETERSQIISELEGLTVDDFVEEVWKERLRELALDFKIWPDIQRTRKYPVTSVNVPGEINFVDVIGFQNPHGAAFQEHHLLYPLANRDLQRNPELIQNDGY